MYVLTQEFLIKSFWWFLMDKFGILGCENFKNISSLIKILHKLFREILVRTEKFWEISGQICGRIVKKSWKNSRKT